MSETLSVARTIPASAERVFNAWLNPDEHSKMTGAGATGGHDGAFTAWDGYISGRTLSSTPCRRIEQSWRTTEFPQGAPDSRLVVTFEEVGGGTRVTLNQSKLPDGQADGYAKGWGEFYFNPMERYFASAGAPLKAVSARITEAVKTVKSLLTPRKKVKKIRKAAPVKKRAPAKAKKARR